MNPVDVFEDVRQLPDPSGQSDFDRLVGLDSVKERLVKETLLLIDPTLASEWSTKYHRDRIAALDYLAARPPLFVLAGDVGTGKTALARSFGNEVARRASVQVHLYSLSLNARGSGAVGEMTRLISGAFRQIRDAVAKSRDSRGRAARGIILLIDEADALAQSREAAQMHHEDRAGVNALIRGVDDTAADRLPVAIVMCTNRLGAIDPAVRRRAAALFEFRRPTREQRAAVLGTGLRGTSITESDLGILADVTGDTNSVGLTYSDLTQRLIPSIVLDAFPDRPITGARAIEIARGIHPTPRFRNDDDGH